MKSPACLQLVLAVHHEANCLTLDSSTHPPTPCSVVYRRHLADDADLEHSEADEMTRRWPVAWLILRPAKYGPRHQLPSQVGRTAMHELQES